MKIINYLLVFALLALVVFSCQSQEGSEEAASKVYPTLNTEELKEVAVAHIQGDLAALGNPDMTGFEVRDTMFFVEHYKRELLIYNRGLADKDRNLNLARKQMNDAIAVLTEDPSNEQAQRDRAIGSKKIDQIEENQRIVDSLVLALNAVSEQEIMYYNLLMSFDGEAEDTKQVNFLLHITPGKEVLQANQTRRKAKSGRR